MIMFIIEFDKDILLTILIRNILYKHLPLDMYGECDTAR